MLLLESKMAIHITSVEKLSSTRVKLTITDTKLNQQYTLRTKNLRDENGTLITDTIQFTGIGDPKLLSATLLGLTTLQLIFSEALSEDTLYTTTNYVLYSSGYIPLIPTVVTKVNNTTVNITFLDYMNNGSTYTIEVNNIKNIANVVIEAPYNKKTFTGVGIQPQLISATATAYNKIRIVFDKDMDSISTMSLGNFSFTCPVGAVITAGSILRINTTTFDIVPSGEMLIGGNYSITVTGAKDLAYNTIDLAHNSANFIGVGVSPQVASAAASASTTIRVTFDENMTNNAAFTNTANYTLAGPTVPVKSAVTPVGAGPTYNSVDITVNDLLQGGSYTVTVSNVVDLVGNTLDPAHNSAAFTGVGSIPQVSSATTPASTTIRITFNENMKNDAVFTNTANYTITGDTVLVKSAATPVGAGPTYTAIDITVSEMLQDADYTVTVSNVTDLVGNVIDPAHNSYSFTGKGSLPQVSSAASTDSVTIRVTFNENVQNDAAFTNIINYVITGDTLLIRSAATPVGAGPTYNAIDITVSEMLQDGDYTVTVSNIVDLVGNIIDPANNSYAFKGTGIKPHIDSAAYVSLTGCTLTFSENMNGVTAQNAANYALSGPSTPAVSFAFLAGSTVTLSLGETVYNGTYTITASNVTDLAQNVVNPNPSTITFDKTISIAAKNVDGMASAYWMCVGASLPTLLAGVYGGRLYLSPDSGDHWVAQAVDTVTNANWISSTVDGAKILAGIENNKIYLSTNTGSSYSSITFPGGVTTGFWYGSAISGNTLLTGDSNGGLAYISTNGGANWFDITFPGAVTTGNWYSFAAYGSTLLACNFGARAYLSTDNGSNWAAIAFPGGVTVGAWRCCAASANALLVGNTGGRIYLSTDNGSNWSALTVKGVTNGNWGACAATGKTLMCSDGTHAYYSFDLGANWEYWPGVHTEADWMSLAANKHILLSAYYTEIDHVTPGKLYYGS